jgi:hypothetical protein
MTILATQKDIFYIYIKLFLKYLYIDNKRYAQSEVARIEFHGERHAEISTRVKSLRSDASRARDRVDRLAPRLQRTAFRYSPPQPNFDPSRVAGEYAARQTVALP